MGKNIQEIRDPIHNFIHFDVDEQSVIDSRPVQRLRYINQLALTYLTYPGATHKRFEHSLGVMELAGRVFDIITNPENINDSIRKVFPQITDQTYLRYWRKVVRIAGLVHDVRHPPFSHAAERELFPPGFDHESMTRRLLTSPELRNIWNNLTPPVRADDVLKVAIGPKKLGNVDFNDWEAVMAEIITGDSFGVDRIDYLLRDSYHAGVAYGRFDHFRLIETLRILPPPPVPSQPQLIQAELPLHEDVDEERSSEPMLGILHGGLNAAESLLLARYFMYSQVYFHPNRIAYNQHLLEFLKKWLPKGKFTKNPKRYLEITDNEVTSAMLIAARTHGKRGHDAANRIIARNHYKVVYQGNPEDFTKRPDALARLTSGVKNEFGVGNVFSFEYTEKGGAHDFPVKLKDGRRASSLAVSSVLKKLPLLDINYIFIEPNLRDAGRLWLDNNRLRILGS
jgi:HD superfamily phosphohydrolase